MKRRDTRRLRLLACCNAEPLMGPSPRILSYGWDGRGANWRLLQGPDGANAYGQIGLLLTVAEDSQVTQVHAKFPVAVHLPGNVKGAELRVRRVDACSPPFLQTGGTPTSVLPLWITLDLTPRSGGDAAKAAGRSGPAARDRTVRRQQRSRRG